MYPPPNIRGLVKQLTIFCLKPLPPQADIKADDPISTQLVGLFTGLTAVQSITVYSLKGETLLPFLGKIPNTNEVMISWEDVFLRDHPISYYEGLAGVKHIQFTQPSAMEHEDHYLDKTKYLSEEELKVQDTVYRKQSDNLTTHILSSSHSLSSITIDFLSLNWDMMKDTTFTSLTKLILNIENPEEFPTLTTLWKLAPRLETLALRPHYVLLRRMAIERFSNARLPEETGGISTLTSLTLHNAWLPKGGYLLPIKDTLRFLSLPLHPYPSRFYENMRGVWALSSNYITVQNAREILERFHLVNLEELRLAADFTNVFANLGGVEELRLDMHLSDDQKVETSAQIDPTVRIQAIAVQCGPLSCLRTIGYLAWNVARVTHNHPQRVWTWWKKFNIIRESSYQSPAKCRVESAEGASYERQEY
ncbi:hypothetical protein M422DRAFT_242434 [Sphaerobolus stellatus SS14]|nr:hypothetical protein M422DRAFT_242434 [Sphaerobolus stellatus SS14]